MSNQSAIKRIVIMGAAGRDFHNFNMFYRDDPSTTVVAFTEAQIPGISERRGGIAGISGLKDISAILTGDAGTLITADVWQTVYWE